MTLAVPALIGADGKYRVHIVGNSGKLAKRFTGFLNVFFSTQSTTGRKLAEILGVPFISLDTLHWNPGWKASTGPEFHEKVQNALNAAPEGWVVDGNYSSKLGDLVDTNATDRIWLDPPLLQYLPRIILRTLRRLLRLGEPCSPGCNERFTEVFFSRDSIIWWCITHHSVVRKRETLNFAKMGLGVGSDLTGRKMRRIGGWGKELEQWLGAVRHLVRSK
ncbi:hypothetical protein MIND_00314000 [Mycena indigotica]|uniref:Uncharacterized protein n=1 Tax=Mycena indigotica TaxID=2126181 RepID=A0A8H6T3W1_9AGAR|nr:uncharacterized protein MIND_00314000 [Mycena indigotica]KAF7309432.1 hypothetical protein MIND_00314000 [Mycena indigotica]